MADTPVKPGYLTTEGWLSFLVAALGMAQTTGFVGHGTTAENIVGLAGSVLAAVVYTLSRSHVKASAS